MYHFDAARAVLFFQRFHSTLPKTLQRLIQVGCDTGAPSIRDGKRCQKKKNDGYNLAVSCRRASTRDCAQRWRIKIRRQTQDCETALLVGHHNLRDEIAKIMDLKREDHILQDMFSPDICSRPIMRAGSNASQVGLLCEPSGAHKGRR